MHFLSLHRGIMYIAVCEDCEIARESLTLHNGAADGIAFACTRLTAYSTPLHCSCWRQDSRMQAGEMVGMRNAHATGMLGCWYLESGLIPEVWDPKSCHAAIISD